MISKTNKNYIYSLLIVLGTIIILSLLTMITLFYITPVLEGYRTPDIILFIKTAFFIFFFIILLTWYKKPNLNLSKDNLKILMIIGFTLSIIYFFSLFLHKYLLISNVAYIIRDHILLGNPNLVFDWSAQNYRTLSHVLSIYSGLNSEIFLLIELLILQFLFLKVNKCELLVEKKVVFDSFLFSNILRFGTLILFVGVFFCFDLVNYSFDILGTMNFTLSFIALLSTIPAIFLSFKIFKEKNKESDSSFLNRSYKTLFISLLITAISLLLLSGLNVYYIITSSNTYRIIVSSISILISLALIIIVSRIKRFI